MTGRAALSCRSINVRTREAEYAQAELKNIIGIREADLTINNQFPLFLGRAAQLERRTHKK